MPLGADVLGSLLDRHGAALVLYARQWCNNPEDVVQEAYIQLARQPVPPADPAAWLHQVVRNGAVSAARAAERRRRHETVAARHSEAWFSISPGARLDAMTVTRALENVPLPQREVIIARLWGGLSFDQIASLTGVSSSTAHRWYEAGLKQLRERFSACPTPLPRNSLTT